MRGCGGVHALSLSGQDFALYKYFKKCIVIYRQVSTAVCLWYSTGELSIAVCLWYSTEEHCKSQLQCACGIVLGNSTDK